MSGRWLFRQHEHDRIWEMGRGNLRAVAVAVAVLVLGWPRIPQAAKTWQGKVVAVEAGDLLDVMWGRARIKIRLYGVDCPELEQPFGDVARRHTARLVLGRDVRVLDIDSDPYNRTVARVYYRGKSLGEEILWLGLGWHDKRVDNTKRYADLERHARRLKKGLWSKPKPAAPWKWRQKHGVSPPASLTRFPTMQQAYMARNYRRAMSAARKILKLSPGDKKATYIFGASACYLKQNGHAQWAFDRVQKSHRSLLRNICRRKGVPLAP